MRAPVGNRGTPPLGFCALCVLALANALADEPDAWVCAYGSGYAGPGSRSIRNAGQALDIWELGAELAIHRPPRPGREPSFGTRTDLRMRADVVLDGEPVCCNHLTQARRER